MKILLQNKRNGLFYVSPDRWTQNVDEAHAFRTGGQAVQTAFMQRLAEAVTLYHFGDPAFQFQFRFQCCGNMESDNTR